MASLTFVNQNFAARNIGITNHANIKSGRKAQNPPGTDGWFEIVFVPNLQHYAVRWHRKSGTIVDGLIWAGHVAGSVPAKPEPGKQLA